MRLFETGGESLSEAKEIGFKNEPELRRPFDENFAVFFPGLERVRSECVLDDVRLDTLAFDKKAKAFVIIEYKRDATKRDIFAQGLSYYKQLQRHQADCVEFLSEKRGRTVMRKEIAWKKTRLIFVSAHFSKHQIRANWDDPPIELRQVRKYPHYLVVSNPDASDDKRKDPEPEPSTTEYSEAAWLDGKYGGAKPTPQVRDLYFALKNDLIAKFQLDHVQQKRWASFRLTETQVCSVVLRKHKLQITYSTTKKDLLPPNDFINDVSSVGRWGRGNYRSDLTTKSDISRAMNYVDLVYNDIHGSGHTTRTTPKPSPDACSEADWIKGKHGPKPSPEIRDLYFALKKALLDEFQLEHFQYKRMASFRLVKGTQVCSVVFLQRALRITYATSKKDLLPPNDFIRDVSNKRNLGIGHYRSDITKESDLSMALECVGRVYRDNKPK